MIKKSLIGTTEIIVGSLGFGFLGIFGKWAFQTGLSVGELLSFRFALATILLWIWLIIFRPRNISLSGIQILISAALGIFGYAVFATLYFTAVKGMSVGLAALLLYTYPFWVSIFSHLFSHEKMTRYQWGILCVAFTGIALLVWGHFQISAMMAFIAGLGSAMTYAAYILVSAKYQRTVAPISSSLYVITFAALALIAYHQPQPEKLLALTTDQWKIILGIATISTIIPITLMLSGLQKLRSSQAALISMLEPVTAALAASVIFKETMTLQQIIGGSLILISLAASIVRRS